MTIAEQITRAKQDYDEVYNKGFADGRKDEHDAFWDTFQQNGKAINYRYAFIYDRFTDETFNPKYPLVCNDDTSASQYMFYNSDLTSTKVPITVVKDMSYTFNGADKLKTIVLLNIDENTSLYTHTFAGCTALENITFEGVIGRNINFSAASKLTHESVMSIINHLKDFSGTTTTRTLTLHENVNALLTDSEKAIATQKGWTLA